MSSTKEYAFFVSTPKTSSDKTPYLVFLAIVAVTVVLGSLMTLSAPQEKKKKEAPISFDRRHRKNSTTTTSLIILQQKVCDTAPSGTSYSDS